MWLSRSLRILAAILATAGWLAGQAAPPAKQAEPRFSLSVSVEPDVVEAGSEVWVKATLTNKAKATTFADLTDKAKDRIILDDVHSIYEAERDFPVYMYDSQGNLASLTYYGRQVIGEGDVPLVDHNTSFVTLRPQDSFKGVIELSKLYDLSRPGKYTVQIQRRDDNGAVAKSNVVTLTVKPKR